LPLLHYYQADGYVPQVFSLLPLALGVGMYAVASRRLVRLLVLLATIGFYRFTYLLNAGDLALACGVLLLVERRAAPPRRGVRWALAVAAIGCLGAAALVYGRIVPLFREPGGFRAAPLTSQVIGLAVLAALFAGVGPACRHWGTPYPPATGRLTRFLALLCGAPVVLVSAWLLSGEPLMYYGRKYAFCSIVLGSLCIMPVVLGAAFRLVAGGRTPMAGVVASALVLAASGGVFGLAWSTRVYTPDFRERFSGPPYRHLGPHADRAVLLMIDATLRREHAVFGGLLTPRWPESHFTNAHYDAKNRERVYQGVTSDTAGHCVFWYEHEMLPDHLRRQWPTKALEKVIALQSSPESRCARFAPRYARTTRLSLCSRCFR
jgi:hypothetical protein